MQEPAAARSRRLLLTNGTRRPIDRVLPTKKFLNPTQSKDPNQGLCGADLDWPGEFVFGYAQQDSKDVEHPLGPKDGGLPRMKNGSFMVTCPSSMPQRMPKRGNWEASTQTLSRHAWWGGFAAARLSA
jgi:hypothetical protein